MLAAYFAISRYMGPYGPGWPAPVLTYSADVAQKSYEQSLSNFELADQVGFDWVTVAEHHFSGFSLTPNPMVMAGAVAQRVKRAKIAVLGPNIPTLNPVRVAEEFAMLDNLTGGRLVAGFMRGTANEYVTYNTNPSESHERFQEALELIRRAWTEPQPFGWQGRFFEYRTISIWPRPVQQPHPPIYMSGSSPESAEVAASNHVRLGFAVTSVPRAKVAAAYYRERANDAGWEPGAEDVLYRVGVHVAATDDEAMEDLDPPGTAAAPAGRLATANPALERAVAAAGYYGRDIEGQRARVQRRSTLQERIDDGQVLCGSPDSVVRQIQRIHDDVGAGVLDLTFAGPSEKTRQTVEMFGRQVLPRIREI